MKDFWLVDPGALEAERELLDTGGHGTGMKLSELVMRDKLQGVTLGDVEFFLQLHSSSGQAVPAETAQACATAIRAKEDQGSPDKDRRIRPEEFDQWAERCTSGRFSTEVEELRRYVKDSTIERYLIEVQSSPNASAANQQSALSPDVYSSYLAAGTTFKVCVEAFGRAFSEAEKMEQIDRLGQLLPFRGKVRLKAPQHTFVLLCDQSTDGRPPRLYFGREVASGQRDLPGAYDLKRRNYIGTTSLDAELALLMASLAH